MKKKILVTLSVIACALLLVVGSVAGTLAYLTATASVENTFTVGNVAITLDETDVDVNGVATGATDRVTENEYHLLPGQTYLKDPILHFAAGSESSWLFVKVVNPLVNIEDSSNTIDAQILAKGWEVYSTSEDEIDGVKTVTTVYVYGTAAVDKNTSATDAIDYPIFTNVAISKDVNNELLTKHADKQIVVTAYAIQAAGLADADAAWSALNP